MAGQNPPDAIEWPLVLGTGALAVGVIGLFWMSLQGAGRAASYRRANPIRALWIVETSGMKHFHRSKAKADQEATYLKNRGYSPQVYRRSAPK